jgi:hypothetical protein
MTPVPLGTAVLAQVASSFTHGGPPAVNWVAVVSVTIALLTIILGIASIVAGLGRSRRRPSDEDDGDARGGGGPGGPAPDMPRGGDGDPAWWPEFERQFVEHVEGLDRFTRAQV